MILNSLDALTPAFVCRDIDTKLIGRFACFLVIGAGCCRINIIFKRPALISIVSGIMASQTFSVATKKTLTKMRKTAKTSATASSPASAVIAATQSCLLFGPRRRVLPLHIERECLKYLALEDLVDSLAWLSHASHSHTTRILSELKDLRLHVDPDCPAPGIGAVLVLARKHCSVLQTVRLVDEAQWFVNAIRDHWLATVIRLNRKTLRSVIVPDSAWCNATLELLLECPNLQRVDVIGSGRLDPSLPSSITQKLDPTKLPNIDSMSLVTVPDEQVFAILQRGPELNCCLVSLPYLAQASRFAICALSVSDVLTA